MMQTTALPSHPAGWLREIAEAYVDARECLPFAIRLGVKAGDAELFHVAPLVMLKIRGLPAS